MTEPIFVSIAGVPVPKGRPRFTRAGHAYTPQKTRDFEEALSWQARTAMASRELLSGPLEVVVNAFFPVPASWSEKKRQLALQGKLRPTTRPDWENIAKVLDSFNKIVWTDDAIVVDGSVHKYYTKNPRLEIEVYPL